ncbi:DUF11 domain-containing protein, partial [Streptomyces sp. NPDC059680]|uniref:DUF11 domain-containing protein n=1 Tax=Streptomyces sp. NPDC059680 TaxID=3346904 RepID=UPI0036AF1FF3
MKSWRNRSLEVAAAALVVLGSLSAPTALGASQAAAAPTGSEFPTSWTINGKTATGTTPSGITVTATLTGSLEFSTLETPSGSLVFYGNLPSYFPATTSALRIDTACGDVSPSGCGTITYTFSQPVKLPVLYIGDIGADSSRGDVGPARITNFHSHPLTLTPGDRFSLYAPGSRTPNIAITDDGATIDYVNPNSRIGKPDEQSSCGENFGCGAFDINTPGATVTSISMGLRYHGTDPTDSFVDTISQLLSVTPAQADLQVTKSAPASATAGGTVSWSATVKNNGPDNEPSWTFTDTLPPGATNVTTSTPGCSVSGSTVTCTGSNLASGASTQITLTGTAPATAGTITNTAKVTGTITDPHTTNNTSSAKTKLLGVTPAQADLQVTKSAPASATAGGTVSWSATVKNNGPDNEPSWTFTDT